MCNYVFVDVSMNVVKFSGSGKHRKTNGKCFCLCPWLKQKMSEWRLVVGVDGGGRGGLALILSGLSLCLFICKHASFPAEPWTQTLSSPPIMLWAVFVLSVSVC